MRQRVTTDGPLTGPQASRSKLGGAMDGGQQEKGPLLLSVEGLTLRLSDGRWLFHDVCFQVRQRSTACASRHRQCFPYPRGSRAFEALSLIP